MLLLLPDRIALFQARRCAFSTWITGGEVDFHASNSTNSSSEQAAFLTSPPASKMRKAPFKHRILSHMLVLCETSSIGGISPKSRSVFLMDST